MKQNYSTSFIWCGDVGESYRDVPSLTLVDNFNRKRLTYFPGSHQPQVIISLTSGPKSYLILFLKQSSICSSMLVSDCLFLGRIRKENFLLTPSGDCMLELPIIQQSPHTPILQVSFLALEPGLWLLPPFFILPHQFHPKAIDPTLFPLKPLL